MMAAWLCSRRHVCIRVISRNPCYTKSGALCHLGAWLEMVHNSAWQACLRTMSFISAHGVKTRAL
jgi:hypothetical protein